MRNKTFLCIILALCACTKVQDSTTNALDTVGDKTGETWDKMRDILDIKKAAPKKMTPQPRYCYRTYDDIICYSKPLPGEDYRMVGFQDSAGHAGYSLDDIKEEDAKEEAKTKKPLKPLKSVTVGAAPSVKGTATPGGTVSTATSSSVTSATPAVPGGATPAADANMAPATQQTAPDQKKLKEIIFDPSQLEPKELVPDKQQ